MLKVVLMKYNIQHTEVHHAESQCAKCHHAECWCVECCNAEFNCAECHFIIVCVIKLNVGILNVAMLTFILQCFLDLVS
jgi:hypothetical protein